MIVATARTSAAARRKAPAVLESAREVSNHSGKAARGSAAAGKYWRRPLASGERMMSLRASLAGSCPENITPHGLVAAVVLSDEIDAGRWETAENLHRAELTMLERANQTGEWVRLTEKKQKQQPAAQVEPCHQYVAHITARRRRQRNGSRARYLPPRRPARRPDSRTHNRAGEAGGPRCWPGQQSVALAFVSGANNGE